MPNGEIDSPNALKNDHLHYMDTHRPWTTFFQRGSTCTSDIYGTQLELISNNKDSINRVNLADSLQQ